MQRANRCGFREGVLLAMLLALGALPVQAAKKWRCYETCVLQDKMGNDGDSIHVKWVRPGYARTYLFRLYWVDTPETDDSFPERVQEQAAYFGISEDDAIKVGKEARKFTEKFLQDGFMVYSKLEDARGRSAKDRDYGNIAVGEKFLAEALVENGLARIYGMEEMHEEGPAVGTFRMRLKGAEANAKKMKLGGWGVAGAAARSPFAAGTTPVAAATPTTTKWATPTAPPVAAVPDLSEQLVTLTRDVAVTSLKDGRYLGTLRPGHEVTVLKAENDVMVRIRFQIAPGKVYEAQCRRMDLGL